MNELNRDASKLCLHLRPIYELELRLGNTVVAAAEFAWTACDFDVTFAAPLHESAIRSEVPPTDGVRSWRSDDPHYPIQAGYFCDRCRHSIGAPLPD